MLKSQRSFRFTAVRFAIIAAIGFSFLTFTVIGTNAAGVSFFDSVKEFFGLQNSLSGNAVISAKKESPNAAFTPGNLVVIQVGDGVAPVSAASAQVALLEYTTVGGLVQTIGVNSTGSSPRLTVVGNSGSESHLIRSSDGNYLTFTGYDVIAGSTGFLVAGTNRVIGRVGTSGTVDLTTAFNDGSTGAVRSAASTNGTDLWMTNSVVGLRYGPFGTIGISTQVTGTPTNTRVVKVFNGQLYMTSGSSPHSCVNSVGTGTPTGTGNTTTAFPGMPCTNTPTARSPYGFSISPAGTTMYVADDGSAANNGGIQKWTFDGANWNNPYTLLNTGAATTAVRGLTVDWSGPNPVIYATTSGTTANLLISVTDTGAPSTATTLATAPTNQYFRGVDFAPGAAGPTPTASPSATNTFTPTNTPPASPTFTNTATATNTATNTATPTPTQTPPTGPTFVISQVYGGGGGTGAYEYDYVEIKNRTASVQSLNLLKLYYGAALGNFASTGSNAFTLPNVSLNPGQFYLVQIGTQGTGAPLPVTPDAVTGTMNMSQSSGKIALVTGLLDENVCGSTATPCDATQLSYIVDWVAYGAAGNGTAGNGEGGTSVNNGVALTNADGGVRKIAGCQDTNDNNADFDVATPPIPRNTSTTFLCNGTTPTSTPSSTATNTPTGTPSATNTATETATPSNTATPTPTQTPPTGPTFVLSQVYGGGGANTGTPAYTNDYVEIKNITASVQSLNLLKLYYGSATGNFASGSSNEYFLPNVSLNPGQFYLVQLGTTGTAGAALPVTPDAVTTNINMAAGSGKIALVTGLLPPDACGATATPCDTTQLSYIVDWVAYGAAGNGGPAGGGEGGTTVNNGVAITNADGGVRKLNGCQDTNNNNNDFDVATPPVPRNMATTFTSCGSPSGSIAGTIIYGNAIGNPVPPRFVKNVSVASTVGSPAVGPVITGTPGTYTLTGFGSGAYTIRPTKPAGPNSSITANDAARIAQGVAGSVPFVSQNQRFSGDTSGNGTVSANDAALVARFAAGLTGFGNAGQWKFFVTGAPSPLPTAPQTYQDSRSYASVTSALTGQDFVALLVGEASGNYNTAVHPRSAMGPERSTSVAAPKLVTPADSEVIIPVSVTGAVNKQIVSYEFDLRYDPSVIQPQENPVDVSGTVSRGLMAVANPNEPGLLRVVLYGAYPIEANGLLLNLRFNAVGAPGSVSPLTFERMLFNEGDPGTIATDGLVALSAAPANQAEITGRLLNSMGQGIPNARVTLTDTTTDKSVSMMSNGFGVYRFGGLQVGQTYTLRVESKHLAFTPLTVSVTSQSVNVDLIAAQ